MICLSYIPINFFLWPKMEKPNNIMPPAIAIVSAEAQKQEVQSWSVDDQHLGPLCAHSEASPHPEVSISACYIFNTEQSWDYSWKYDTQGNTAWKSNVCLKVFYLATSSCPPGLCIITTVCLHNVYVAYNSAHLNWPASYMILQILCTAAPLQSDNTVFGCTTV